MQMQRIKAEKMKRREIIRKKNSMMFLVRMKQLASLPEFQNARFHIPVSLIQYSEAILTPAQIDNFIAVNNLIVRERDSES